MKKQLVQKSLLEKIFLKQWYESSDHLGISIVYVLVDDVEKQVIYNNTFGVSNDNPTTYYEGETDILLKDINRDGYKFLGWYSSPTFEDETRVTMISKDEPDILNLYAKWKKINGQDDEIISNSNSLLYITIGVFLILTLGTILILVYKHKKGHNCLMKFFLL